MLDRLQEAIIIKYALALLGAPCMLTVAAAAQEATPAPSQPAPTQPVTPEQIEPAGDVSDEEVSSFALTALVLEQVTRDTSLPEEKKQAAMMGVMQQTGMQPQRFNQIALAGQSDTALQQRIQAAAQQHIATAQQQQVQQPAPEGEQPPSR